MRSCIVAQITIVVESAQACDPLALETEITIRQDVIYFRTGNDQDKYRMGVWVNR